MSLRAQLWVASDCQCPCACLGSNITPLARSRSHVEFDDPSRHNSPPVSHQRRLLVAAGGALIASPALVLVMNLVIGALTPPMGMLVFTTARVGNAPVVDVFRAIGPFLVALIGVLTLVTYLPALTTGPVRWLGP